MTMFNMTRIFIGEEEYFIYHSSGRSRTISQDCFISTIILGEMLIDMSSWNKSLQA